MPANLMMMLQCHKPWNTSMAEIDSASRAALNV